MVKFANQRRWFYLSLLTYFLTTPHLTAAIETSSAEIQSDFSQQDHVKRKHDYHSTKLNEIVEWIPLEGGQYILGLCIDQDTRVKQKCAIYDRTFPAPKYKQYWRYLILSTIGVNDLNLGNLAKKHDNNLRDEKEKMIEDHIYSLMFQDHPEAEYPSDWWKNPAIKWKAGKKPNPNGPAPRHIPLTDLDLDLSKFHYDHAYSKLYEFFEKFRLKFSNEMDNEDEDTLENNMQHSYLILQANGRYKLELGIPENSLPPTKVIDLRGRFSSYGKALSWGVMTQIAKACATALALPGVSNVAYALLERFFNLVEVLYLNRHGMALSMVLEALEGNQKSPFYGVLTESELHDAITYLRRSSTILSDLIYLRLSNKWTVSDKYVDAAIKARKKNLKYLVKKGYKVYPFENSFYAMAVKRDKETNKVKELKVFSLIKTRLLRNKPHEVVDFTNPKKEVRHRNAVEAMNVAVSFLYFPIPFAVSIFRVMFKELFIREFHRRGIVEAGFRSHLNHNKEDLINSLKAEGYSQQNAEHFVDLAYRTIYKREVNPVDIAHEDEGMYMEKVDNWIRAQNPNYLPIL